MAAALDTTNDGVQNYDTLVVFERSIGIRSGPFNNLITGPAYLTNNGKDQPFYLEGSNNRVGTGFFVSKLDPLFWTTDAGELRHHPPGALCLQLYPAQPARDPGRGQRQQQRRLLVVQPRLPHRRAADSFVRTVQRRRAASDRQRRHQAVRRLPGAAGGVLHAADARRGPGHGLHRGARRAGAPVPADRPAAGGQPRPTPTRSARPSAARPTSPTDPKVAQYAANIQSAYQYANGAVQKILDLVGTDANGVPRSDVIVVSDHGFDPFHAAGHISEPRVQAPSCRRSTRPSPPPGWPRSAAVTSARSRPDRRSTST